MKIAHIHGNSHIIAGQEKVLINMASGLSEKGVEVTVVLPKDGILAQKLEDQNIKVKFINLARFRTKNPFPYLRCIFQLFIFAKREKISIFHASGVYPNQYCVIAAKLAGIKCICHVHTTIYKKDEIHDSLLAWSNKIITVSNGVKKMLKEAGICESKIQVVYNGVDLNDFFQSIRKTTGLRESLGIPVTSKIVGQVGQIIERKGVEYFIRMAKVLLEKKSDLRFLLIGDDKYQPGYMDKMKNLVNSLGLEKYVIFTGFKENAVDFLSILDVMVLCSSAEGLAIVLIEAALLDKPKVCADIPGCNEVVEDGVDGFLVPAGDSAAFAEKVGLLLDHPEIVKTFVGNAKKKVKETFGLDHQVDQVLNIYRELFS